MCPVAKTRILPLWLDKQRVPIFDLQEIGHQRIGRQRLHEVLLSLDELRPEDVAVYFFEGVSDVLLLQAVH